MPKPDRLYEQLGRIEAKLDRVLTDTASQDERITSLEGLRERQRGAWGAVAVISAGLASTLTFLLTCIRP